MPGISTGPQGELLPRAGEDAGLIGVLVFALILLVVMLRAPGWLYSVARSDASRTWGPW